MNMQQRFEAWEQLLESWGDIRRKDLDEHGMVEIRPLPPPAARLATNSLEERWAQRYVAEYHQRLGFGKVRGPFDRGPDFQVLARRRWHWAEVETRWQNYLAHGHYFSSAFTNTRYLILLSPSHPPDDALENLPPQIVHIDIEEFLEWFEDASKSEMIGERNTTRIDVVAGEMQEHWVTICSDRDRDMAACPDCDGCPYFGEGIFGEAQPHFHKLAAYFMAQHAITDGLEANLAKLQEDELKRFVELTPPTC